MCSKRELQYAFSRFPVLLAHSGVDAGRNGGQLPLGRKVRLHNGERHSLRTAERRSTERGDRPFLRLLLHDRTPRSGAGQSAVLVDPLQWSAAAGDRGRRRRDVSYFANFILFYHIFYFIPIYVCIRFDSYEFLVLDRCDAQKPSSSQHISCDLDRKVVEQS